MACLHYGKNVLRRSLMHHALLYAAQGVRYRKLEVILTTSIDKLGRAGETVTVAPGHFRNHLIAKAACCAEYRQVCASHSRAPRDYKFIIEGKGNELRYPVSKEEILAEVARKLQVQIEPENLQLPTPLSSLVSVHTSETSPIRRHENENRKVIRIRSVHIFYELIATAEKEDDLMVTC
ncbi:hypothetical protein Salat_0784800 [Sesamum alatum]|uniref:Large ribosomal subunit protein bL9c n=1 Tax=Sesamum alatum TaxID=300844 RepID=A0AAE1YU46_9LAMI|nr:hypothetical protein Salat_0784800 [Sesamum alatum]